MIKDFDSIKDLPQYAGKHIGDNLFFSDNYKALVESEKKEFFILANEEYAISVMLTKKMFFIYCSFLYHPICLNNENSEDKTRIFLDECVEFLSKKKGVQFILLNPAYSEFISYPRKSKRIPFGNYVCNLEQSEDELFSQMHSKHRNSVRKAQKDGVYVKYGRGEPLLSDYVYLDEKTWIRSGKHSSGANFYESKIKNIPDNCMFFVAYKDAKPQSAAFIYYDSEYGYYMFGANEDRPYTGSGNLLQWEIMRFLKQRGVKKYSFVGCRLNEDENSKYHDIQRFKARFGGELKKCYLFKCVCNPFMYGLFTFIMSIKAKKVVKDAIDQEIGKWRDLNKD